MRWALLFAMLVGTARAGTIKCADSATADLQIDGLLDDWRGETAATAGGRGGAIALRCIWDGVALALALDIEDDRIVRTSGHGHQDHVDIRVAAGTGRVAIAFFPRSPTASEIHTAPSKVSVAGSTQPHGFSIEALVPISSLAGFNASTPSLALAIVFHDSDAAVGGADSEVKIDATIELPERKGLLEDFLRTTHLKRSDLKVDTMVDLDPDRRGKERLVAGGNVIGVLTEQFAYVTIDGTPEKIDVLPIGPRGQQIISALVVQPGKAGTRSLLMLWTVWSGQLSPLVQIEVRRSNGDRSLANLWKVVGKELVVTAQPAVGFTADTWPDDAPVGADEIVVPWDKHRKGVAYSVTGAEIKRRDLRR